MYKYDHSISWQHYVRAPRQVIDVQTKPVTEAMQSGSYGQFWSCVTAPYASHVPATSLLGKPIHVFQALRQQCVYYLRDLVRNKGGDRVANLAVLRGTLAAKEIVVRKRLQPRTFSNGQTTALSRIVVDVVVAVLVDVGRNSGGWRVTKLYPEAIGKISSIQRPRDIAMVR